MANKTAPNRAGSPTKAAPPNTAPSDREAGGEPQAGSGAYWTGIEHTQYRVNPQTGHVEQFSVIIDIHAYQKLFNSLTPAQRAHILQSIWPLIPDNTQLLITLEEIERSLPHKTCEEKP